MSESLVLPPNHWVDLEPAPPHECPYLPDREIVLDVGVALPDGHFFDALMARGYRRLGQIFYRPTCHGCRECVPIRVPVESFHRSKSQRRLLNRVGARYSVRRLPAEFHEEHFEVYERHAASVSDDNTPSNPESYTRAFLNSNVRTHLLEYRVDGKFVAASVLDEGEHALSSVYVFWDPDYADLSPGTFSALWEIAWAAERSKSHYYLGYWIAACAQMRYKNRFRPYELMDWQRQQWVLNRQSPPENWPAGSMERRS